MAYINYVYKKTNIHGSSHQLTSKFLPDDVPILGPTFLPVSPSMISKRHNQKAKLADYYLKPVTVIHPFYDSIASLVSCSACANSGVVKPGISYKGWGESLRVVHGMMSEEYAIGYQMECDKCKIRELMTSNSLWEHVPYWKIPRLCLISHARSDVCLQYV